MFSEEIPRDLSLKANTNESEDKSEDKPNESNDQTVDTNDNNSIDLSVKKKSVESSDKPIEEQSDEQPMEQTLDLSMNTGIETNSNSQPKSETTLQTTQQTTNNLNHLDIQLSDNEEIDSQKSSDNQMNGFPNSNDSIQMDVEEETPLPPLPQFKELSEEELRKRQRKMRRLKQELRNEEMKLVLLKKLRQSQLMKENIVTQPLAQPNHQSVNHSAVKTMTNNNMSSRNGSITASLPTPNISIGHNRSTNQSIKSSAVLNPPIGRNQSLAHGPHTLGPPPIGLGQRSNGSNHMPSAAHSGSLRPGPLSSMNRTPVTTPPNVVLGYPLQDIRGQTNASNSLLNSHQSLSLGANGSPGPNSSEMNQTPAQRQAAAKLALRKQLEKTLLQIPPPKPPPPEMHFIPNANNQEFVYYLGLETVVDFLTDSPNQNRPPPDPFECVQCGTDFTPVWKWQDRIDPNRDRPAVICETCVTSNIKKALKAEHTNRLKTAFVKALQQEQEIEQRIASGATSPPLPTISPPPQQTNYNGAHQSVSSSSPMVTSSQSLLPQAPPAHSSMPRLSGSAANAAAAAAAVASSAALLQQMPKLSAAHQSLFAAQAQQLHQLAQSLPQPQPAHMLPFGPLLAAQAYSYSMLGKSGVPSSELHRQYLLDMIPSRSLPHPPINWKT